MVMPPLTIRRATVDDLPALLDLWAAARLPGDELKDRLTEFQIVETDGRFAGAIGFQILRQHARLHSEDYVDFSLADTAREAIWERIQKVSANHGVFRLWTQDNSPFWSRWGFQPATAEMLERLPEEWKTLEGAWLTLPLKNEDAINEALDKNFAGFMAGEKQQTAQVVARVKTFRTVITVIAFAIGILSFSLAIWMLMHRSLSTR